MRIITQTTPAFESFIIASACEYLGFLLVSIRLLNSFGKLLKSLTKGFLKLWEAMHRLPWPLSGFIKELVLFFHNVAALAVPSWSFDTTTKEMGLLHKKFRMPSNCGSTTLCHSIACCFGSDPICLTAYCRANLFRPALQ